MFLRIHNNSLTHAKDYRRIRTYLNCDESPPFKGGGGARDILSFFRWIDFRPFTFLYARTVFRDRSMHNSLFFEEKESLLRRRRFPCSDWLLCLARTYVTAFVSQRSIVSPTLSLSLSFFFSRTHTLLIIYFLIRTACHILLCVKIEATKGDTKEPNRQIPFQANQDDQSACSSRPIGLYVRDRPLSRSFCHARSSSRRSNFLY